MTVHTTSVTRDLVGRDGTVRVDAPRPGMPRRRFLQGLGTVSLTGAALGTLGGISFDAFGPGTAGALADALSQPLPAGTPILVLIDLEGGNDWLNTIVPVQDGYYRSTSDGHGAIALNETGTLALNGSPYRLNSAMPWLAQRWNGLGDVAVVHGVGQWVAPEFSHFVSADNWRTGVIGQPCTTGFLGRLADNMDPGSPVAAVSFAGAHGALVGANTHVLSVADVASFRMQSAWRFSPTGGKDTSFRTALNAIGATSAGGSAVPKAAAMLRQTLAAEAAIAPANDPSLVNGVGDGDFAWQLAQAAMLIRAGLPCRMYAAVLDNFDFHSDLVSRQATQLGQLDDALRLFFGALAGHPRIDDVIVAIHGEFGRKITANDSGGTDHGQAACTLFIGRKVRGGNWGQPPTLNPGGPTAPNRIEDSPMPTVDFRSVFTSAVNWLARDAGAGQLVYGQTFEDLGLLSNQPLPMAQTANPALASTSAAERNRGRRGRRVTAAPR